MLAVLKNALEALFGCFGRLPVDDGRREESCRQLETGARSYLSVALNLQGLHNSNFQILFFIHASESISIHIARDNSGQINLHNRVLTFQNPIFRTITFVKATC